jgi:hypothetical protein
MLAGCSSMPVAEFDDSRPLFDPVSFFTGVTRSSGVIETRGGNPAKRITTKTEGVVKDGSLIIDQELAVVGSKVRYRHWKIRRTDAHHVEATANDIAGTARGEVYGNALRWSFTLVRKRGNPLANVRMSQSMYLQPGGETLIIRSVIRKAGIVVAQVTEQFRKERSTP